MLIPIQQLNVIIKAKNTFPFGEKRDLYVRTIVLPLLHQRTRAGISVEYDAKSHTYTERKIEGTWRYVSKTIRALSRLV